MIQGVREPRFDCMVKFPISHIALLVSVYYLAAVLDLQYNSSLDHCTKTQMHTETKYHEMEDLPL